jgi:hypothetical protein
MIVQPQTVVGWRRGRVHAVLAMAVAESNSCRVRSAGQGKMTSA